MRKPVVSKSLTRPAPPVVVSSEVANLAELRQEILKLQRRIEKLAAFLRPALALLQTSGFRLSEERLPDKEDNLRILRAVDQAHACMPLRAVLRLLHLSPSRFRAWRRRQSACALDDESSCPRTSPHRLTPSEVQAIGDMVTSPEYPHVPTGTLAVCQFSRDPRPGVFANGDQAVTPEGMPPVFAR